LRTRVTGDQVGAAIAVERHDTHTALASDLGALHQAFSDKQLRVESLTLVHGTLQSGASPSDSGGSAHQRDTQPQRAPSASGTVSQFSAPSDGTRIAETTEGHTIFDSNGRLSVRA
jgi:hypothetical protein